MAAAPRNHSSLKEPVSPLGIQEDKLHTNARIRHKLYERSVEVVCNHEEIVWRMPACNGLTLVNFDSHSDLAVHPHWRPAVIGRQVTLPVLDCGEWIVPLLFGGNVSHVVWVAPSELLESDSLTTMAVGLNCHGEVAVAICFSDANEGMFTDECARGHFGSNNVIDFDELAIVNRWTLRICTAATFLTPSPPLLLSVDEDYFYCENPFLNHFDTLFPGSTLDSFLNWVDGYPNNQKPLAVCHWCSNHDRRATEDRVSNLLALCEPESLHLLPHLTHCVARDASDPLFLSISWPAAQQRILETGRILQTLSAPVLTFLALSSGRDSEFVPRRLSLALHGLVVAEVIATLPFLPFTTQ